MQNAMLENLKSLDEEPLKTKIREQFFSKFEYTQLGKIDFCIYTLPKNAQLNSLFSKDELMFSFLWAEAKRGIKTNEQMYKSLIQLILTIGRAQTHTTHTPPKFLGAFDAEKIIFIPYDCVADVLNRQSGSFNWSVMPSDHNSKEFLELSDILKDQISKTQSIFFFDKTLAAFIKENFNPNSAIHKIAVNNNNFPSVYQKWVKFVKPTIGINWEAAKKINILDADFFIADLMSEQNCTFLDLSVLLKFDKYEFGKEIDEKTKAVSLLQTDFNDEQTAHTQFWNIYERPPKEQFRAKIINRRDLLVPQDVRERKGSFFTPQIWVQKSQSYIAQALGQSWQDEYYIWDCAAGTGNLLVGLTEKDRIFASTLDKADVDVMHERIANGANLLKGNVFQFDFLNDPLDSEKIPQALRNIISDSEKRKKLLIYINPPYAEAGNARQMAKTGENKTGVSNSTKICENYKNLGLGIRELFAQFLIRVRVELENSCLAQFSTLKIVQGSGFVEFRQHFTPKFLGGFCVPANTFDNVKGQFPIGFMIWDTSESKALDSITLDVFDRNGEYLRQKIFSANNGETITSWISKFTKLDGLTLAYTGNNAPDYQNNTYLAISSVQKVTFATDNKGNTREVRDNQTKYKITESNLIPMFVYFSVRHCIKADWLNDRDQFYAPDSENWALDSEFQGDCLAFALFHNQNRISAKDGTNYLIPFKASELNAHAPFESFLNDFINGKIKPNSENKTALFSDLPQIAINGSQKIIFSESAHKVLEAGREIFAYYHCKLKNPTNEQNSASLYDIKEYFKGRDEKGRMRNASDDEHFNALESNLKLALNNLAPKIAQKAYEYGFLKN